MNFKYPVLLVLLLSQGFASCKVNDDSPSAESQLVTGFNVVNATTDTLNFYLNGSRVNTTSSLYPFGSTGLISAKVGKLDYQFKRYGRSDVLFTLPLALDSGKNYSLFLSGVTADGAFATTDTLLADTSGRAKIRFVNASPDAGNLDVRIGLGDTVFFKVRAYKTATVFLPATVGIKRVRVYKSGSATALSDTTRTLLAGRVYTLFSKGTLTGTGGAKFGTGLIVNQ